jgi:hypothetical protein
VLGPRCSGTRHRGGPSWSAPPSGQQEQALLSQFIAARERGEAALAIAISAEDLRVTMPPPFLYEGLTAMALLLGAAMQMGDWRVLPTTATRMPAAARAAFECSAVKALQAGDAKVPNSKQP